MNENGARCSGQIDSPNLQIRKSPLCTGPSEASKPARQDALLHWRYCRDDCRDDHILNAEKIMAGRMPKKLRLARRGLVWALGLKKCQNHCRTLGIVFEPARYPYEIRSENVQNSHGKVQLQTVD